MALLFMCQRYLNPLFISIWDIEEGTKLVSKFNSPARITAAEFLNPHDISFLLTGSGISYSLCVMAYIVHECCV